jgi:hypothetical protein
VPFDTDANGECRYRQIAKMMNTVLIVIAAGVVAVLVKWLIPHSRRSERIDPGYVSHQWVTEHRLSQMADSRR